MSCHPNEYSPQQGDWYSMRVTELVLPLSIKVTSENKTQN